jgi:hypothetical protein
MHKLNQILIFGLTLWFLSTLPYFNLVMTPTVASYLIYLFISWLLKLSPKIHIYIGLTSLVSSLPWLLVGNRIDAEFFGVFAFLAFCIGIIMEIRVWRGHVS